MNRDICTCFKERITGQVILSRNLSTYLNLSREDDGNDEPIDGNCLAEDDGDQVLGFDPWSLHTPTNNAEMFH